MSLGLPPACDIPVIGNCSILQLSGYFIPKLPHTRCSRFRPSSLHFGCDRCRSVPRWPVTDSLSAGDLLTKVDRVLDAFALKVRSPFMDHRLVRFAAGSETESASWAAGRSACSAKPLPTDLPAWVFRRPKMGFAVPIGQWLKVELREMLHDHLFAADSFASRHFVPCVLERLVKEHQERQVRSLPASLRSAHARIVVGIAGLGKSF